MKPSLQVIKGPGTPPTIILEQHIEDSTAEAFQGSLDKLAPGRPKEIRVIINSDGGEIKAGFAIAQMIERYPAKVTCIVDVRAQSMASAILQSCDIRIMTKRAFIMMHQPNVSCESCTEFRLREAADGIAVIAKQLAHQTCRKSKMKPEEWLAKTTNGRDWSVDPEEALKLGFIDSIIPKVTW